MGASLWGGILILGLRSGQAATWLREVATWIWWRARCVYEEMRDDGEPRSCSYYNYYSLVVLFFIPCTLLCLFTQVAGTPSPSPHHRALTQLRLKASGRAHRERERESNLLLFSPLFISLRTASFYPHQAIAHSLYHYTHHITHRHTLHHHASRRARLARFRD